MNNKRCVLLIICLSILILQMLVLVACGDNKQEPHTHNYVQTVVAPTCTAEGYTLHKCSCGDSYTDSMVAAKGHDCTETVIEPTCTVDGYTLHECVCGYSYTDTVVKTSGHDYQTEWTIDKAATCKELGEKSYHCNNCDARAEITSIIGEHNFVEGACTFCGVKKVEVEEATGLEYTLSDDESYYIVTGIGTESRLRFKIPALHEGKPVKKIGDDAFSECYMVKEIVMSEGLEEIGQSAFEFCYGIIFMEIPDSVTTIGAEAFAYTGIRCLTLGSNVQNVLWRESEDDYYETAFDGMDEVFVVILNRSSIDFEKVLYESEYDLSNLTVIQGDESTIVNKDGFLFVELPFPEYYFYDQSDFGYNVGEKTIFLIGYDGDDVDLVLPSDFDGKEYVIGDYAFSHTLIENVTLSDGVVGIGYGAFADCMLMEQITLGNSVEFILADAFCCTSITEIAIPASVKYIEECFDECNKLESIKIYSEQLCIIDGMGSVFDQDCFAADAECQLEYNIYDNACYLGNENNPYVVCVKALNEDISSCIIHENATLVDHCAFMDCQLLETVVVGKGVSCLGNNVFWGCSALTTIEMGADVSYFGSNNLTECFSFKLFKYAGTKAEWDNVIDVDRLVYADEHSITFKLECTDGTFTVDVG